MCLRTYNEEEAHDELIASLDWLLKSERFHQAQTGMNISPSDEFKKAEEIFQDLKDEKLICIALEKEVI